MERALRFDTKTDKFMGYFEEDIKDFRAFYSDQENGILYFLTATTIITYDFAGS
jgi:hypothetical protein